jgi:mycothiol synthase
MFWIYLFWEIPLENSTSIGSLEIQGMRDLMRRLSSKSTVVDFEEQLLLSTVQSTLRCWKHKGQLISFAFIDDYNNLWFETEPESVYLDEVESEIVEWGIHCIKRINTGAASANTLDSTCPADHSQRIKMLEKYGFESQSIRSLYYSRSLNEPIPEFPLPQGYTIRCVHGKHEVEELVTLHRAAFGTDHMTIEQRLAMMSTPDYVPELDLVAVAPDGELAAFCVCGISVLDKDYGTTDPIGTHPKAQRLGLGKAIVSEGLLRLKSCGAKSAKLGTSSENIAMQNLAASLGFICILEKRWFSKAVL